MLHQRPIARDRDNAGPLPTPARRRPSAGPLRRECVGGGVADPSYATPRPASLQGPGPFAYIDAASASGSKFDLTQRCHPSGQAQFTLRTCILNRGRTQSEAASVLQARSSCFWSFWSRRLRLASAQSRLSEFLRDVPAADLVPGADHYGSAAGQSARRSGVSGRPALRVTRSSTPTGSTPPAIPGKPIQILVGLGADGKITGARLMDHHEPIVLIGIPPERIAAFIRGYVGRDVLQLASQSSVARPPVDIVSGATVTVTVIAESIVRSAIRVARAEGIGGRRRSGGSRPVQRELDPVARAAPEDWAGLLGDGSVRRLQPIGRRGQRRIRARRQPGRRRPPGISRSGDPFIDLYVAPVSVPAIGTPPARRRRLRRAASKASSPGSRRSWSPANGALFVQGLGLCPGRHLRSFRADARRQQHPLPRPQAQPGRATSRRPARPTSTTSTCSACPEGSTLDPAEPWRLQLLVQRGYRRARQSVPDLRCSATNCPQDIFDHGGCCAGSAAPATAAAPNRRRRRSPRSRRSGRRCGATRRGQIAILLVALAGPDRRSSSFRTGLCSRPRLLRPGAARLPGLHAGLARLVRAGAAFGRQRARLPQRAADAISAGTIS